MSNGKLLVTFFTDTPEELLSENTNKVMLENIPKPLYDVVVGMTESYKYLTKEQSRGGSYVMISNDYGITWSKLIHVPVSCPHGPALLRNGKLVYLGTVQYDSEEHPKFSMCAFESSDDGYTWKFLSKLSYPKNFVATDFAVPHTIELSDGSLLALIRTRDPDSTLYQTESYDGGKNWTEMHPIGVIGYPAHLIKHSTGALVCSFGRCCDPISERAIVSYDNGKTWEEEYIISSADHWDLGYPASVELDDGSILTVYYQKYGNDNYPSILYTKWKLKDK